MIRVIHGCKKTRISLGPLIIINVIKLKSEDFDLGILQLFLIYDSNY